ncbi:hypothetical protein MMC26_004045 [Xylographa opegraphella]|nr:hypothetical protein [Xylographa opegraphella]
MEAFLINAIQFLFGDREIEDSTNRCMDDLLFLGIAQKYVDHLNAKWSTNNNHRLERALLSFQKERELARQNAENTSALDESSASVASGNGTSCGEAPSNAAVEVTIRETTLSEGSNPIKNGTEDASPVSDYPALTRTQTLESPFIVPTTPIDPHPVAAFPTIVQAPSISPRQISDCEPISMVVGDVPPRNAPGESSAVIKADESTNVHAGLAWAGYGRKTRFVRRKSAAECALSSNHHEFEVVEEKFEGNYPVHPSQMVGEGAFRIGRCANIDEALQEMKRRLGPHVEPVLQMTIQLLGKDAKVRGHEFTYHDLYCILYEHRKKPRKPVFIVKTLDDGVVVQEGFPVKPVPLSIYPQDILHPTGDQIYRGESHSSLAITSDLADLHGAFGNPDTNKFARTTRSTNVLSDVKPHVRFDIPETRGRQPLPTADFPKSRQPRRRVRSPYDPKITNLIEPKIPIISPKSLSTVVTKDEAHGSIQQVHISGRSKVTMDKDKAVGHGLLSSLRRQAGRTPLQQVPIRRRPQLEIHDDKNADRGLSSSPIQHPQGQVFEQPLEQDHTPKLPVQQEHIFKLPVQTHGRSQHNPAEDTAADHGLSSAPPHHRQDHVSKQLVEQGHAPKLPVQQDDTFKLPLQTLEHPQHKSDDDSAACQGLSSSPLRRRQDHASKQPLEHNDVSKQPTHTCEYPQNEVNANNNADHGLFSSPLRRRQNHASEHSLQQDYVPEQPVQTLRHSQHKPDDDNAADQGLFQSPLHHQHGIDENNTIDQGPSQSPLHRQVDHISSHQNETHGRFQHKRVSFKGFNSELQKDNRRHGSARTRTARASNCKANPVRFKPRSADKNTDLSSNSPTSSGMPPRSSEVHPFSYHRRRAVRVGSPLINVTNAQEHHSGTDESVDNEVPDFVDRSGESPAAEEEDEVEAQGKAGGIAAAIAAQKAKWRVRIPGSAESVSSNACESLE